MKNFIRLTDLNVKDVENIFKIADEINQYKDYLSGKTVVLFFPNNSIRTRVSFEKGIYLLGGQPILFPTETLDKKEEIKDVIGYLNNFADCIVVRHSSIELIENMAKYSDVPIINAMTSINHPCEILSDLYALSKIRTNYLNDKYLFVGENANIGYAWKEASKLLGFELTQCCPNGFEIEGLEVEYDIEKAVFDKDIILSDSLPKEFLDKFSNYLITTLLMEKANKDAILNPCPPFYRGETVSEDVIDSKYFVGYEFKKSLLCVQQAIILYCMGNK